MSDHFEHGPFSKWSTKSSSKINRFSGTIGTKPNRTKSPGRAQMDLIDTRSSTNTLTETNDENPDKTSNESTAAKLLTHASQLFLKSANANLQVMQICLFY